VSNSSDVTAQVKTELIMLDPGKILITLGGVKGITKEVPAAQDIKFPGAFLEDLDLETNKMCISLFQL
jgi:hypothetical protein